MLEDHLGSGTAAFDVAAVEADAVETAPAGPEAEAVAVGNQSCTGPAAAVGNARKRFSVWQCNIRGFVSKAVQLAARVRLAQKKPDVICLNETFLDKSIEDVVLEGYVVVARLDRQDGRMKGGVLVFARAELESAITCVKKNEECERVWLVLHTDSGPQLLGAWYRPPDAGGSSIESLRADLEELGDTVMGCIVVGDMNVHHERWLRYSNGTSAEGRALQKVAAEFGLKQHVKKPTRFQPDHLLDLVLSDMEVASCEVLPVIADHAVVAVDFELQVEEERTQLRKVWQMGAADWVRLRTMLEEQDWTFLSEVDTDEGARRFTEIILTAARECVPEKWISERKSKHPWLNQKVLGLVQAKAHAHGTDQEIALTQACSDGVLQEFHLWVQKMRDIIARLPRGSKQWWSKTRELLMKVQKVCSIPALKNAEEEWVRDAKGKADLLAVTFGRKNAMRDAEENEFSEVRRRAVRMHSTDMPTEGGARHVLQHLDPCSATGPDELPTRILRECAEALARPLCLLACQIVRAGNWPELWLEHWIVPLYKKKAVFQPGNYRGVHLTAQLSKAMERLIGQMWLPEMASDPNFFGPNQFAYSPGKGARDALAVMVLTWLEGFWWHRKFGLYCSDVSGAFDKVDAGRLEGKLRAKGFRQDIRRVITSWLRKRRARVVVGGARSNVMELINQVFQGTVWGPTLWNLFFEDARFALEILEFVAMVFADDLNAYRAFPGDLDNSFIMSEIDYAQEILHRWGAANRVEFDPGKESKHVLSLHEPAGGNFKILGVDFDCKLVMEDAVHETAVSCGWKLQTMMRSERFFSGAELVDLYKAHVLSFVEYRTAAVYHASTKVLNELDAVQRRMMRVAGITELEALFVFNLAPLRTRRDIAMLGVIHRAALGLGPVQLQRFFRRAREGVVVARTRLQHRRHPRQLVEYRDGQHTEYLKRSALGLVSVYNLLPATVVVVDCVSVFQGALQALVKERALASCEDWQDTLSPRIDLWRHPLMRS